MGDAMKALKEMVNAKHGPKAFDNMWKDLNQHLNREPKEVEMMPFIMGHLNVMDPSSRFNKNYSLKAPEPQPEPMQCGAV